MLLIMYSEDSWNFGIQFLSDSDPVMKQLTQQFGNIRPTPTDYPFVKLVESIIGQQISGSAANSIRTRLKQLVGEITPQNILQFSTSELRTAGLSGQKAAYIMNIAEYFIAGHIDEEFWKQDFETVILPALTSIKGVGRWTVQMLGIFHLGETNILPTTDLGIINGAILTYPEHFTLDEALKKRGKSVEKKLELLGEKWKPYRSIASLYLWKAFDESKIKAK